MATTFTCSHDEIIEELMKMSKSSGSPPGVYLYPASVSLPHGSAGYPYAFHASASFSTLDSVGSSHSHRYMGVGGGDTRVPVPVPVPVKAKRQPQLLFRTLSTLLF